MPPTHLPQDITILLRAIRNQLLGLPPRAPYSCARLLRIADQLDYCLQLVPLTQWPATSLQGESMPAAAEVRASIAEAQRLLRTLPLPCSLAQPLPVQALPTWLQAYQVLQQVLRLLV
jgi:hypothetical protein